MKMAFLEPISMNSNKLARSDPGKTEKGRRKDATAEHPQPTPENIVSTTPVDLIKDGGNWGALFLEFLLSKSVNEIYVYHGLDPA